LILLGFKEKRLFKRKDVDSLGGINVAEIRPGGFCSNCCKKALKNGKKNPEAGESSRTVKN